MEIVINNRKINLSKLPTSILLISNQELDIDTSNLTEVELKQIFFAGMPNKKTKGNYLSLSSVTNLKHTLNRNVGLCLIYWLIEQMDKYNFFIIHPLGVDPIGIKYLVNFINILEENKKKFFVLLPISNNVLDKWPIDLDMSVVEIHDLDFNSKEFKIK